MDLADAFVLASVHWPDDLRIISTFSYSRALSFTLATSLYATFVDTARSFSTESDDFFLYDSRELV